MEEKWGSWLVRNYDDIGVNGGNTHVDSSADTAEFRNSKSRIREIEDRKEKRGPSHLVTV
jgi:hypothetical protein